MPSEFRHESTTRGFSIEVSLGEVTAGRRDSRGMLTRVCGRRRCHSECVTMVVQILDQVTLFGEIAVRASEYFNIVVSLWHKTLSPRVTRDSSHAFVTKLCKLIWSLLFFLFYGKKIDRFFLRTHAPHRERFFRSLTRTFFENSNSWLFVPGISMQGRQRTQPNPIESYRPQCARDAITLYLVKSTRLSIDESGPSAHCSGL